MKRLILPLIVWALIQGRTLADLPAIATSATAESIVTAAPAHGGVVSGHTAGNWCGTTAGDCGDCGHGSGSRVWGSAEYLLWRVKGASLPPLLQIKPPSGPFIYGNDRVNEDVRSGGRVTLGFWLDDCQSCGIGGSFFMLERQSEFFNAGSPGDPGLSRPYIDALTGQLGGQVVADPILSGTFTASTSTDLLGADAFMLHNLASTCNCRVDALIGYRFLRLREAVTMRENLNTTDPQLPAINFMVYDRFDTENRFHGGDLGLASQLRRGRFTVDLLTRIALGCTERRVNISGGTTITAPQVLLAPLNLRGGLLALDTNIGSYRHQTFSVVPEVRINVGYQISDRLRAFVGYNFLYWTDVARPGDQIDVRVNPNFISPVLGGGPALPAFQLRDTSFWAQGISFGLAFNY